jgi:hypothetical protein
MNWKTKQTYEVLMTDATDAWPEAVMILDFRTSAGEQTAVLLVLFQNIGGHGHGQVKWNGVNKLVAIVPYSSARHDLQDTERNGDIQHRGKQRNEGLDHLPLI